METNELVKQAKQGQPEAFGLIYDQFAQKIFRFIRLKVQNRSDAEDVLQDAFIKAFRGLPGLKLDDLNFNAWLYRVAANTINDYFRKKYRTPETTNLDEAIELPGKISVQAEAEVASDMESLKPVLDELPSLYKQVLELRFIQDFSVQETAQALGKSNLSVRLIQHRAIKRIKAILKQ